MHAIAPLLQRNRSFFQNYIRRVIGGFARNPKFNFQFSWFIGVRMENGFELNTRENVGEDWASAV